MLPKKKKKRWAAGVGRPRIRVSAAGIEIVNDRRSFGQERQDCSVEYGGLVGVATSPRSPLRQERRPRTAGGRRSRPALRDEGPLLTESTVASSMSATSLAWKPEHVAQDGRPQLAGVRTLEGG